MNKHELLRQAEYVDIILTLLQPPFEIDSVSKLVFIAFCVKHANNNSFTNRKKDIVDTFFENISLKLTTHQNELMDIIVAIDLLKKNSIVIVESDYIQMISDYSHNTENLFLIKVKEKIPNPIIEINKLDTKALIEEVIRYV